MRKTKKRKAFCSAECLSFHIYQRTNNLLIRRLQFIQLTLYLIEFLQHVIVVITQLGSFFFFFRKYLGKNLYMSKKSRIFALEFTPKPNT